MRKPDIFVIGAMKAATSSICSFLEDHDEVFMPPRTEPCFFSADQNWARGTDWYEALFADAGASQLIAEGSNDYTFGAMYPDAPQRMSAYAPDAKLIYMVRHPISRIVSAWIQNRANRPGEIPPTLDEAVTALPERFVDPSLYWRQLERYRALYPDTQIFVGYMEEMSQNPASFFPKLCEFLGIDTPQSDATQSGVHKNPSAGKAIPTGAYNRLRAVPGMRGLAKLMPKDAKKYVKQSFSKKVEARPQFSPQVREELVAKIKPDAEQFLRHTGQPLDLWDWAKD